MNKRAVGTCYEQLAIEYLKKEGYDILEKNYRCRFGEIDIIGKEEGYLTFIEVKYRKDMVHGGAWVAVGYGKQRRICKVASYYMLSHQILDNVPCRFDVVAINGKVVELIRNAFEYNL